MNEFLWSCKPPKKKNRTGQKKVLEKEQMSTSLWPKMLCINSLRGWGSQFPMLIDIPIKEMSRLEEEERAREQRSYCRVDSKRERIEGRWGGRWEDGIRKEDLRPERAGKTMHQMITGTWPQMFKGYFLGIGVSVNAWAKILSCLRVWGRERQSHREQKHRKCAYWLTELLSPSLWWVTVRRAVNYADGWIKTQRTRAAVCAFTYHTAYMERKGERHKR